MSHKKGVNCGGVVTLEDLKGHCVLDEESACWHLRTARGRPMPKGDRHVVWSHTHGAKVTATRLSWMLAHDGRKIPEGFRAYRCCASYDCVNPEHIKIGNAKQWGAHMAKTGKATTPAKTMAARNVCKAKAILTPELRQWLLESTQNGGDAGHGLGIKQSRANFIRAAARKAEKQRPAASVFEFAMRAAA